MEHYLNHCPRCATDIAKIRDLTGTTPHQCPACRMSLVSTEAALSPDLLAMEARQAKQFFATIVSTMRKVA